jgi:hypothetical protein
MQIQKAKKPTDAVDPDADAVDPDANAVDPDANAVDPDADADPDPEHCFLRKQICLYR